MCSAMSPRAGESRINQHTQQGVDPRVLTDLAAQLRQNLDALILVAERPRLAHEIEVIGAEAEAATPDVGKLKRALIAAKEMIREAGKGAATSLITQGALALIEDALKHL